MKIGVFGMGYVGCVTAACLARDGHDIIGVDINPLKIDLLRSGKSPIMEPGLDEMIEKVVSDGKLNVCLNANEAILDSDVSLICVGTPSNHNGSLKLDFVENVCREIGRALAHKRDYHVVVIRSTVLPGTVVGKLIPLLEEYSGKQAGGDFGVCMNPEFLREGTAIKDYYNPGMVIIGEIDKRSGEMVKGLYNFADSKITRASLGTAEMVKYVSNAYHALKVVFANEIGNLCKAQGLDGQEVMEIFMQDHELNISSTYLTPGFAFGGSCLPKDVRAIAYRSKELDIESPIINAILPSNRNHIENAIRLIEQTGCKKIGILGLSFKPNTDDLRESPTVFLVETLLGRGYQIKIFDEKLQLTKLVGANKVFLEKEIPHISSLLSSSMEEILSHSEVIVTTTGAKAYDRVVDLVDKKQKIIDLVGRIKPDASEMRDYEGVCW